MIELPIEYYLPEKVLNNEELETIFPQYSNGKIYEKTGIKQRHIADKDELVSDMAQKAIHKLFELDEGLKDTIDFMILCTQTPDYQIPTTACILQERVGLSCSIGALDVNLGCSGFVYSLALAKGLLCGNIAKKILLVMTEEYSKHIHELDSSTRTIFGDGACAMVVTKDDGLEIGEFVFGTDGSGKENLMIPASGESLKKYGADEQTTLQQNRTLKNLYMNGTEIFDFTLERIPQLIYDVLEKNNMTMDEVDLVIPHQANRFMLQELNDIISIPERKWYVNMEYFGNTVSASIPIALKSAMEEQRIKKGSKILLIGFGVGYSWGGTVITLH